MRNTVNRKVNCETANINKTGSAAVKQIDDIRYIEETKGLDKLPEGLKDMALTRLTYPEASLKELGALLQNPVGKSGVNHRLRKLSEMADSSSVYIEVDQKQVNAKSIMGMMSLTLMPGEEITVVANGTDEKEAAAGIERFLVNVKNR